MVIHRARGSKDHISQATEGTQRPKYQELVALVAVELALLLATLARWVRVLRALDVSKLTWCQHVPVLRPEEVGRDLRPRSSGDGGNRRDGGELQEHQVEVFG